jgi:peptide/nickel transport system substrate-binding protein
MARACNIRPTDMPALTRRLQKKGTIMVMRTMLRGLAGTAALAFLTTAAISAGTAPAQAAGSGAALRWGTVMEVSTLDPVYGTNYWELVAMYNSYDTLLWPDAEKGVKPWLAESWTISPDGREYAFKIRAGQKFHDGSEITAEDVAFSMVRMLTVNGPSASSFRMINASGISYEGDTVTFKLDSPNSSFLKALLLFRIVNKDLILANLKPGAFGEMQDYGNAFLRTNDAGSGPYELETYRPGEILRLKKFDGYTLAPQNGEAPATVEFQVTPEIATIVTKLRAGELDIGDPTLPSTVQRQLGELQAMQRREDTMPSPWFVIMDNARAPLDDVWVRRAVASAYDRDTVTKHILGAGGPLAGPVPAEMLPGCEGVTTYPFDLAKAREYLSKSKYPAGELSKRKLQIAAVAGSDRFNNVAMLLATNLTKIGIPTEVRPVRWADIVQAQTKPETAYDFVLYYDPAKVSDPTLFLNYYTKSGWGDPYPPGGMYYENPKVTELVQAGIHSTDPKVQTDSYCQANKLIAEDSPAVFSHTEVRQVTSWDYVKGFLPSAGAIFYDMRFENWAIDQNSKDFQNNQKR